MSCKLVELAASRHACMQGHMPLKWDGPSTSGCCRRLSLAVVAQELYMRMYFESAPHTRQLGGVSTADGPQPLQLP